MTPTIFQRVRKVYKDEKRIIGKEVHFQPSEMRSTLSNKDFEITFFFSLKQSRMNTHYTVGCHLTGFLVSACFSLPRSSLSGDSSSSVVDLAVAAAAAAAAAACTSCPLLAELVVLRCAPPPPEEEAVDDEVEAFLATAAELEDVSSSRVASLSS